MTNIFRELKKIAKQISGSENIFGYKTTEANRLFVFYCIFGNVFFTDKVHRWVKYFWYFLNSCEILFFFVTGLAYFWYEANDDIMLKINVANAIGAFYIQIFGFPLISYLYSDSIEATIELVDEILTTKGSSAFNQRMHMIDVGVVFGSILGPMVVSFMVIYASICFFDVVLFFDEAKVKNYLYYAYATPLMQEYGTMRYFIVANGISTLLLEIYMFQLFSSLAIVLQWNTVCCNELIGLRKDFDDGTHRLNEQIEKCEKTWNEWNDEFENFMQRGIKRFQKTIRLINSLRGYVEIMGSFVVPTAFCYSVAVLYFSTVDGLPFVLKIKFLVCYVGDTLLAFVFYRVGQNLENQISEVTRAVYSTPWYWSLNVRKNVHLFLCQTQSVKNFAIIKVYGLLLKNFSKFSQAALTYTNFLHKFTSK